MSSVNRSEHFWFMNYSLSVRNFLRKALYLSAYPADKNVEVYYATPPRAFTRFVIPVINGATLHPTITFRLATTERAANQTPNGFAKQSIIIGDNRYREVRHPLVYELNYRATCWVTRQADMDILMYQATVAAPFNRKYAVKVDGQWAELEVANITDETNLDPGEAQDVSRRFAFDIKIPRAYLPLDYVDHTGIIKRVDISLEDKNFILDGIGND